MGMSDQGSAGNVQAMFKRFLFLTVMIGAVGVPYMLSVSSDWWKSLASRRSTSANSADGKFAAGAAGSQLSSFGGDFALPGSRGIQGPVEGYGRYDLAEVLNFDGSPSWVMSRWPRVTVGLAEPGLQGYRMPLVTGTGEDDVAGSLTYYFDRNERVKLIHFRGTTGNPHKLIGLVTGRYGFVQQPTGDPSLLLYQVKWNGKPTSELRIRTSRVLRASQPHARFQVELAMNRP